MLLLIMIPSIGFQFDNLVCVLGICPEVGYVVMEYFKKVINGTGSLKTLGDLLLHYGDDDNV